MTAQSGVLLEVLAHAEGHRDAETLYGLARRRDPGSSLSTVYRTLALLIRHGVADELRLGGERHVYELRTAGSKHAHLICAGCGRVQEAAGTNLQRLRGELVRERGFSSTEIRLDVQGRSRRCAPAV